MVQHTLLEEAQAILAAVVGGARYGIKIRIPHALVMTVLFRRDLSGREKIRSVLKLAMEHASNLAMFAAIYKATLAVLKRASRSLLTAKNTIGMRSLGRTLIAMLVDGPSHHLPASLAPAGEPDRFYHSFVSGFVGGYFVWGKYSSVNYQILLYLTSRVLVGLAQKGWEKFQKHRQIGNEASGITQQGSTRKLKHVVQHPDTYPWIAATVWGIVMMLFEESPHVLHKSLKSSMDEIYRYQLSDLSLDSSTNSILG